jgi:hypothetical protein
MAPNAMNTEPSTDSISGTLDLGDLYKPLNILGLPDEMLMRISDHVKGERWRHDVYFFMPDYDSDIESLKNFRLTCRRFCNTSSHLLLRYVHVTMAPSSIAHLEVVARHPAIGKGIRAIRVCPDFYSYRVAKDISCFAAKMANQLRQKTRSHEDYLLDEDVYFYDTERCKEPFSKEALMEAIEKGNRIAKSWEEYADTLEDPADEQSSKHVASLKRAYRVYCQRYEEQESIVKDGTFVQAIATAMAHMPSANWLRIQDAVEETREKGYMELVDDPDAFFEQEMRPYNWTEADRNEVGHLATEILVQLPLTLHEAGITVMELDVGLSAMHGFTYTLSQDQLQSLRAAADGLRGLGFSSHLLSDDSYTSEEVTSILSFLSIFMGGKSLRELDLYLSDLSGPFIDVVDNTKVSHLGILLATRSWPKLETLILEGCHFHLTELEKFLNKVGRRMHLRLSEIRLLSGTWADALDIIRTKADRHSEVEVPSGAECETMSEEETKDVFDASSQPYYTCSKASKYIQGHRVPNPLRELDAVNGTADGSVAN